MSSWLDHCSTRRVPPSSFLYMCLQSSSPCRGACLPGQSVTVCTRHQEPERALEEALVAHRVSLKFCNRSLTPSPQPYRLYPPGVSESFSLSTAGERPRALRRAALARGIRAVSARDARCRTHDVTARVYDATRL